MECTSFVNRRVSSVKVYGLVVSGDPTGTLSTSSWTLATPVPTSEALTTTLTVPVSEAPGAGEEIDTTGGVVSCIGGGLPAARKATICMTQLPGLESGADALYELMAVTTRSSAMSPSGEVITRDVKPVP